MIPPLTLLADLSIHQVAATALFTFVLTGLYGAWLFHRRGSHPRHEHRHALGMDADPK